MRIIVSDSSCLIDLRKASLLNVFLRLPCEILVPDTLFEDELLLRFSPAQKELLLQGGLAFAIPGTQLTGPCRRHASDRAAPVAHLIKSHWIATAAVEAARRLTRGVCWSYDLVI
jgi:hypothetical protein